MHSGEVRSNDLLDFYSNVDLQFNLSGLPSGIASVGIFIASKIVLETMNAFTKSVHHTTAA